MISTLDRSLSLKRCLESALNQDYPSDAYEIVVVDHGSRDNTAEVIKEIQQTSKTQASVLYVYEDKPGLHDSRHAGANVAKGDVLLYTDDDATLDGGWLSAYASAFEKYPEMAAASGPARPVWEAPIPPWLEALIGSSSHVGFLSLIDRGDSFQLSLENEVYGVNMAVRREALFLAGGFNPESFEQAWLGDGDSGLARKLTSRGMPIGYVPDAGVRHYIPPTRMTVNYLRDRYANQGAADAYTHFQSIGISKGAILRYAARIGIKYWAFWLADRFIRSRTSPRALSVQGRAVVTWSRFHYAARLLFDRWLRQLVERTNWLNGNTEASPPP